MRSTFRLLARAAAQARKALRHVPVRRATAGAGEASRRRVRQARPAVDGLTRGEAQGLQYLLYRPPGIRPEERLPLLVMLHGCGQDAAALASSSAMNRVGARNRFLVLYPEQNSLMNPHRCWHWYDHRSGRARREAIAIAAVVDCVCLLQPVDAARIAVAGLSAGAAMAALLVLLQPERFRALIMHSGLNPGAANSLASALRVMGGRGVDTAPPTLEANLPPLLVIHGDQDRIVHPANATATARWWSDSKGAKPIAPRRIQRGHRYVATVTDYCARGRVASSVCEIHGLAHAWSGGARGQAYSDPKGPDASRMIWSFAARQFARANPPPA